MGRNKKISKIAKAVQGILGDEIKGKRLKKEKAIKRFLVKMKARRTEIQNELKKGGLKSDREKLLKNHLHTLKKQIDKASKIADEMDS